LTDATLAGYVDVLRRRRPRYIYAYASAVHVLARFVLEQGIDLSRQAPVVVFTTADMLYPSMRRTITRAFHCPVSVEYGSRDGGFMAHECPEGRLHVHADRVLLEILKGEEPVAPGELGEIVLTSLDAMGMPFIRYRTADVGAWDDRPCPCGRVLPVLRSLEGRTGDFLIGEGGRLVHGLIIADVLDAVPGIDRFRAIQADSQKVVVEILPLREAAEMPLESVRSRLQGVLGAGVEIVVNCVDSIPLAPSGKHRAVISDVAHRYFEKGE
jgi:phenylacetate-CoA ligase